MSFGEEDPDEPEIDWDEVDYQLRHENLEDTKKELFPLVLRPGQVFPIDITLDTKDIIGEFVSGLEIWCLDSPGQEINSSECHFTFDFKAISQPALQFNSLHSSLGPISVMDTKEEGVSLQILVLYLCPGQFVL